MAEGVLECCHCVVSWWEQYFSTLLRDLLLLDTPPHRLARVQPLHRGDYYEASGFSPISTTDDQVRLSRPYPTALRVFVPYLKHKVKEYTIARVHNKVFNAPIICVGCFRRVTCLELLPWNVQRLFPYACCTFQAYDFPKTSNVEYRSVQRSLLLLLIVVWCYLVVKLSRFLPSKAQKLDVTWQAVAASDTEQGGPPPKTLDPRDALKYLGRQK